MKRIRINWKKTLLVMADLGLMAYLAIAMGHLNTPDQTGITCKEVGITISDQSKCGFLSAQEVKNILTRNKVYPKGQTLDEINPRDIENVLKKSSLIYDNLAENVEKEMIATDRVLDYVEKRDFDVLILLGAGIVLCFIGLFFKPRWPAVLGCGLSVVIVAFVAIIAIAVGQWHAPYERSDLEEYDSLAVDTVDLEAFEPTDTVTIVD
jgi:hypothetical protein